MVVVELLLLLTKRSPIAQPQQTGIVRFGAFELEPQAGVLRKHGVPIRLQEQPLRVLLALLEEPGRIVTREELQQKLWSDAAFGDFEHSLNIAINKVRQALGDSADKPRFVETVPRRGYRFIAPVEGGAASVVPAPAIAPTAAHGRRWLPLSGAAVAIVVVIACVVLWMLPPSRPRLEWRRLTNDGLSKHGPVLSDGSRLFFRTGSPISGAPVQLVQIPASGGAPTTLPIHRRRPRRIKWSTSPPMARNSYCGGERVDGFQSKGLTSGFSRQDLCGAWELPMGPAGE